MSDLKSSLAAIQKKAKERTVKTQTIEYDLETLVKKIKRNIIKLNPELSNNLNELGRYKTYVKSWKYKELIKNSEINKKLLEFWRKMLILSIVSDDYADWINETWAWKQFFWDQEIWNSIIKLNFIYIFTL